MTNNEIIQIIQNININSGLQNPTYYYKNGGCYIFAKQLQSLIGGKLRYLLLEQHFVLEYNNKLYDTTGNVTNAYKNSKYITESAFLMRPKLCNGIDMY